jgi:phosphopantothenoylcysteine decarboxylase/phosphopantothenate--cysteine ligase
VLQGKKIVLGVTGSIAAYKSALLVRLLVKAGAQVKVIMTPAAKDFVTPLTFSTLSKNLVYCEFSKDDGTWNNHVELANWADFILIAPASANTLAKIANGLCDNLLLATCLSASCPIYIAPAMDREMYSHPSTKANLKKLQEYKTILIPAEDGELASGLFGEGRMAEPEHILSFIQKKNAENLPLAGLTALVSAGPTYEAIDPVRFIGNHSSGKMGFAIAEELALKGAKVTLVHGPVQVHTNIVGINSIAITSAEEMYKECTRAFSDSDIAVMSAAVADFKPAKASNEKIKKTGQALTLELKPTLDILFELGKRKKKNQLLIGFALETSNEQKNATEKLKKKNLDAIILNSMKDKGAGPGGDNNQITILDKHNKTLKFELKPKAKVATDIVNYIIKCLKK